MEAITKVSLMFCACVDRANRLLHLDGWDFLVGFPVTYTQTKH